MVLDHLAAALAGLGLSLWNGSVSAVDVLNGTFGSIVAVTGDAHQAQVAQDIFRQEVRKERSLIVREDIRDAHRLMIDNVQTQLLMGNIILGICFTVLIEGKPSDAVRAPVVVQELWAVCSVWSISLAFLSVWFALQYQEQVSVSSRKRLLEKHRITTPNDEVVGRMGGLSLAEKVAQLHQRGLDEITDFLESQTGCEGARKYLCQRMGELLDTTASKTNAPAIQDQDKCLNAEDRRPGATHSDDHDARVESFLDPPGPDMRFQDSLSPQLDIFVVQGRRWPSLSELNASRPRQRMFGEFVSVRAMPGTRGWYDEDKNVLLDHYIVDLPDFLAEETLIRMPWSMPGQASRRSIRIAVHGAATLYVAAQWPPLDTRAALRGQGPPQGWSDKELPSLRGGQTEFHRVEGFSVFVSHRKMDLPLYRAALQEPDATGWRQVKLRFQFQGSFDAPVIIIRRGAVLTSEQDWPVREFMNELDKIQPLRDHSMSYMSHGLMNLLLAAFFAHLGRVLTDRPWPACRREVFFVVLALFPAVIIALQTDNVFKFLFNMDVKKHPRMACLFKKDKIKDDASIKAQQYGNPTDDEVAVLSPRAIGPWERLESPCSFEEGPSSPSSARQRCSAMPLACCAPAAGCGPPEATCGGISVLGQCQASQHLSCEAAGELRVQQHSNAPTLDFLVRSEASDDPQRQAGSSLDIEQGTCPLRSLEDFCLSEMSPDAKTPAHASTPSLLGLSIEFWRRPLLSWCHRCPKLPWIVLFYLGVRCLWGLSIGAILLGRLWIHLHHPFAAQATCSATMWTERRVFWPSPFFLATAATMGVGGDLWFASDWHLGVLSDGSERLRVARLPFSSKGLYAIQDDTRLLVAASDAVYVVNIQNFTLSDGSGLTAAIAAFPSTPPNSAGALPLPIAQLGQLVSVTAGMLPAGQGRLFMAMAPEAGGVYLSTAASFFRPVTSESTTLEASSVEIALRLPHLEAPMRAMHLNMDQGVFGEPTLWALDATGLLTASGLESGQILRSWRWTAGAQAAPLPTAMTGNSTHLVLVVPSSGKLGPRIMSAPYAGILAHDESLCS